ncbi:GAF domain-containing sensor histidine kinase [Longimicrobium terrae]|uniref:histidine kinase n=1 Tax=Longimicrobium terrae TaxID=1639882 RepID=A0A841GKK8_9BACT|nr:GAF domain-containing sensor histidine kinase [Longimicrobium terrae]MBB4634732.1 hypothetical protein [Longimicrobium terrae]MBB6069127.1 hypothetical protein [Longimicrobium terrae]
MDQLQADIAAVARIDIVPTILRVVSEMTGLRLVLVARVTQDAWTAAAVLDQMEFGLNVGDQLDVTTTLCSQVRDTREPVIIEHASEDPDYCGHPTPRMYGFESYIALPIYRNGEYFGTICGLDSNPATLRDEKTLSMVSMFAELISTQLAAEDAYARDREALATERASGQLREQFIAVLGHDLRNPLSSIVTGSEFLLGLELSATERTVLERIRSSGERMSHLINDVLDFARGRLGGGVPVYLEEVDTERLVRQVVEEVASGHPARTLRITASTAGKAWLDESRAAQLLSNLVSNAVQYSPAHLPVDVRVEGGEGDNVVFSVHNGGDPIPAEAIPRLFDPYVRAERSAPRTGLGLGLYIASEIVRAHGGEIRVESSAEAGTMFTVELPRLPTLAAGQQVLPAGAGVE